MASVKGKVSSQLLRLEPEWLEACFVPCSLRCAWAAHVSIKGSMFRSSSIITPFLSLRTYYSKADLAVTVLKNYIGYGRCTSSSSSFPSVSTVSQLKNSRSSPGKRCITALLMSRKNMVFYSYHCSRYLPVSVMIVLLRPRKNSATYFMNWVLPVYLWRKLDFAIFHVRERPIHYIQKNLWKR